MMKVLKANLLKDLINSPILIKDEAQLKNDSIDNKNKRLYESMEDVKEIVCDISNNHRSNLANNKFVKLSDTSNYCKTGFYNRGTGNHKSLCCDIPMSDNDVNEPLTPCFIETPTNINEYKNPSINCLSSDIILPITESSSSLQKRENILNSFQEFSPRSYIKIDAQDTNNL